MLEPHPAKKRQILLLAALLAPATSVPPCNENDEQRLLKLIQRLANLNVAEALIDRFTAMRPHSLAIAQARADIRVVQTWRILIAGNCTGVLERNASIDTTSRAELNLLGVAALAAGNHAVARGYFNKALPWFGEDGRLQQNLALAAVRHEDCALVQQHWRRCAALLATHWPMAPLGPSYMTQLEVGIKSRAAVKPEPAL